MRGDRDAMMQCTTPHFDGLVAMMDPSKSWVGRWQGISKLHPGVYALKVYGNLSEEMVTVMEENGLAYAPNEED
ncbi:Spt4/RpoE2 zinc finger-domain-containing protein [Pavlovales sp. CCMP2436]|nr:Spt4/RpoE2 zinc finger-domain-containing protein [Pavlovales sp. CCMP2436]